MKLTHWSSGSFGWRSGVAGRDWVRSVRRALGALARLEPRRGVGSLRVRRKVESAGRPFARRDRQPHLHSSLALYNITHREEVRASEADRSEEQRILLAHVVVAFFALHERGSGVSAPSPCKVVAEVSLLGPEALR